MIQMGFKKLKLDLMEINLVLLKAFQISILTREVIAQKIFFMLHLDKMELTEKSNNLVRIL